jgi:TIR domain
MMSSLRSRGSIFISYRREDTAADAGRLYDHLSDRFGEDRVFMDIDSIAIGLDFTKAVIEAVSICNMLLVLVGRGWLSITDGKGRRRIDIPDDWVRVEIEAALLRDIPVVPVLVDGAAMPQAEDLPSSLRPFVRRQAFLLSHTGFKSEIVDLMAAVDKVLEAGSSRSAEVPKTASADRVAGQGKWQLKLVTDGRFRKTFHVSSDTEAHQITVKYGIIFESIAVDGKPVVRTISLNATEYPLTELSSKLGCAVTITVGQKFLRLVQMDALILKIGNQVLTYESNLSSHSSRTHRQFTARR